MSRELVLILGGTRSGKSAFAQQLARGMGGKALFVATAQAGDGEMQERVRRHRASRPSGWATVEEPVNLAEALGPALKQWDVVLVDCLTLWVSNLLLSTPEGQGEEQVLAAAHRLLESFTAGRASLILVTGEVGMGIVPLYPLGRQFRDILGTVNQLVAARADRAYLLVAGLALELKALGARPLVPPTDRP